MRNGNRFGAILSASVVAIAVSTACSERLRAGVDGASEPPAFTKSDAGTEGEAPVDVMMCKAFDCPAPFATCLDKSGLCTTNLDNDVNHCGSCDEQCPAESDELKAFFICATGRCQMLCRKDFGDCDKLIDNGCEARLESDPLNCGACGKACSPGEICWKGACGCPSGKTNCNGKCVDLRDDDDNCGACGRACGAAPTESIGWSCGEGVIPDGASVACVDSQCKTTCTAGRSDCNKDFCRDGCEVFTNDDTKHCGSCGTTCKDEQICSDGKCLCDPGTTRCDHACVDLQSDVRNCGACGNVCPGLSSLAGSPVCKQGRCSYACAVGYADCDGRLENGCEVDTTLDALHCGSCTTSCDVAAGQPCVAGKCLTQPCDAGALN
ncbi:Tryptophan synthase alpha chain [Labilithrix luteola]|uniref:Tryptophan synthase alpha chain n=1 Tax=Labilithrix luteola TaxID=1391654 RepID=A0A0K1Q204_9BACT|nr:hypothetical protein [Labilithrix luteola]AKU99835.1 Tryptophan synthase alpha chain [Labilithrix luteola]